MTTDIQYGIVSTIYVINSRPGKMLHFLDVTDIFGTVSTTYGINAPAGKRLHFLYVS
jgi:hypothetical protein